MGGVFTKDKIFVIGFAGTGKTYECRNTSTLLDLNWIDMDHLIEKDYKTTVQELFKSKGEKQFRMIEKGTLDRIAPQKGIQIISTGGGTPCFHSNLELMKNHGLVVWLNTPLDIIKKRLEADEQIRPVFNKSSVKNLDEKIEIMYQQRLSFYEQADKIVKNGDELLGVIHNFFTTLNG